MSYRTDRQRVQGLGSAREGTGHFWQQRLTAIALVPLFLLFVFPFSNALGTSHENVVAVYSSPFNAIVAILFILVAFRHLGLGLQVIIEDYISDHGIRTAALIGSILLCSALALAGVFAVAKIAFIA
jgi:succinate dehydrogenase / fumarate reductase membrane anchor subunit